MYIWIKQSVSYQQKKTQKEKLYSTSILNTLCMNKVLCIFFNIFNIPVYTADSSESENQIKDGEYDVAT